MKTLYDILNKEYHQKLVEHKEVKKQWKQIREHMESCHIPVLGDDDVTFFQYEIIEKSLGIKEQLEETFFDVYVRMYDYWYDLTYQERKKQMNIDIHKRMQTMTCFQSQGQEIYMPCFDEKFNHLYTDEIVLLDLKQYHSFIRTFAKQIRYDYYGALSFLHGFSSAQVIALNDQNFVLFHERSCRLYHYEQNVFKKALSLDKKRFKQAEKQDVLEDLAKHMLENDEDSILDILLEGTLISNKMIRKLGKYKKKKAKYLKKMRKKAEKNHGSE